MEYLIAVLIIVALLFIKAIYDSKATEKNRLYFIQKNWGQMPEFELDKEQISRISKYYQETKRENLDVDDITWNDMDMDRIFHMINNTQSSIGEEYLYAMLRKLEFREEKLEERERLITFFKEQEEERIRVQKNLTFMGKLKNMSFYKSFKNMQEIGSQVGRHVFYCFGFLISSVLLIWSLLTEQVVEPCVILFIAFLVNNIISYYKRKAKIDQHYYLLSYVLKLLFCVEQLSTMKIKELGPYQDKFKQITAEFRGFRKKAKVVTNGSNMSGSLLDSVMDYIRMLFHVDLIVFDLLIGQLIRSGDKIQSIYEDIGFLDSMIAVASFRTMFEGETCIPTLYKGGKPMLKAVDMYHPYIDNPVKNTIGEMESVLITGSNASGKSTFIKTVAMNAILAQTIHTCMCKEYEASFFKVYSSMALADNLMGKESYYIVEIKSLKRILEQAKDEIPVLCFVDEVLRGTNTIERIAASSQILSYLAKQNVLCFAATHDIELTYMLEKQFINYHFQEEVIDGKVIFNYQLKDGRATSRNAIKLLEVIGYPTEVINNASEGVNHFLQEGAWAEI